MRIRAVPERGKANSELIALLAQLLGVSRRDITITVGASSRDKVITVSGVDQASADAALSSAAKQ